MDLHQAPSISAFLHQLAALVLDLRTEIAWSFEEAQQAGFLSSLHALNHGVKEALFSYNTGLDSWSYSVPFACSSCGRLLSMSAIDCIEFCRRSPFLADEKRLVPALPEVVGAKRPTNCNACDRRDAQFLVISIHAGVAILSPFSQHPVAQLV